MQHLVDRAGLADLVFRCAGCGHGDAYSHHRRLIEECRACGEQHSILAGTIFEQTKTGLSRWFLAIWLVTSSKGGIRAMELKRQMGFGSYQTAWAWLHKIRGASGKTVVAGALERGRGKARGRRLGRLRLQAVADASARSLEGFLTANLEAKAAVTTDGWSGYGGLAARGYAHEAINLSRSWGEASLRLPAIHLVFGLAKRWLLGTHHGAVRTKHLQAYLDDYVFRFNRRTAKSIAHRFARLIQHAVQTPPTTYRAIVAGIAA